MVIASLFLATVGVISGLDQPVYVSGSVTVQGVKLHYLDWGGKGEPLLLLSGTGDTAYAFTDFAPRFTDRFRVIALTRRGYGKSGKPSSGYDISTLAKDALGFLDKKGIKQTNIICHSAGGDETTYLAVKHPNRVRKLVYMEAAYNRCSIAAMEKMDPMGPAEPSSKEQALHWKGMDAFRPNFKAIKAPVLSFYSIFEEHPAVSRRTSFELREKADKFFWETILPYQLKNIAQFKKDLPTAKVVELHGTDHYFFEDPKLEDKVVATIRDFLAGTP